MSIIPNIMSHINFRKVDETGLIVDFCDNGIMCEPCFEVMYEMTKEDLKLWCVETFNGNKLEVTKHEWVYDIESVLSDPIFFLGLGNGLKKFLGKKSEERVLLTIAPLIENHGFQLNAFVVEVEKKKDRGQKLKCWSMTEPLYCECRELGDLDEFEFFVEAIPFKFNRKEREYINALPKGSQIRVALENQLDEFTENVLGGNTSLFGVFNQSEGLN